MGNATMEIEGLEEIACGFDNEAARLRTRSAGVVHPALQYEYIGQAKGYDGAAARLRALLRRMQDAN